MSLTSLSFLGVYFPLLLIVYYNPVLKNNSFRKLILLSASIGLYSFCEPIYVILLLSLIVINYSLVKISDCTSKAFFRLFAIIIDVGTLLSFKYINKVFSLDIFDEEFTNVVLPIGLSYFTFKAISYVVDSKKQKDGALFDVAIYISNFMTIVSGPLSMYHDELPMIREKNNISFQNIYIAIERLCIGLAKKVIIADSLNALVNQSFTSTELSCVMAWTGAIAYTLQLYFDFSGYTDMAIGIGALFGFTLPENFNYPYMASSISDFWKRWHMSLTKWFTKYIYIPLGGSRVNSVARHIFNLFIVWLVTGIWHGSNMTFIVWALIYFVLQILEKYTKITVVVNKYHLGHIYTMIVVIVEWIIFRSDSLGEAVKYIKSMFMMNGNVFILSYDLESIVKFSIPLLLGIIFSTNVGEKVKTVVIKNKCINTSYNVALFAVYVICIIISISQGFTAPLYAGF